MAAPSPRRKRLLLALVLVPVLSALGLEVGARILDRVRGRPFESQTRRAELETAARTLSRRAYLPGGAQDEARGRADPGTAILQPYVGWEHLTTQVLIADELDWYRSPESETTYDVCVMGGSVAQTFADLGQARLVELLERDPLFAGREVRVHNLGCAGFKQPQPMLLLAYLLALGHRPDAVIEIDGFNDAALGWTNGKSGAHPAYPSLPHWAKATSGLRPDWDLGELLHDVRASQDRASEYASWILDSGLWRSCFLAHALGARLEGRRREYVEAYKRLMEHLEGRGVDAEIRGPRFDAGDEPLAAAIVGAWEASSRAMRGICAERGIAYLHVLQPALHDEGSKPLTEKEIAGATASEAWIRGVTRIYPRLRESGERLAARGFPFLDASRVFRDHPEDVYVDVCHFREHGNEILAAAVAEAFLHSLR